MEECIVCFDNIEVNSNIKNIYLECCNNYVHENCLQLWISTNIYKNKDINLCIYCKKNNTIITNIINNYNEILPNNIDILITNNNNNNNEIIIVENRYLTKKFIICSSFFMFLLFFFIYFNLLN